MQRPVKKTGFARVLTPVEKLTVHEIIRKNVPILEISKIRTKLIGENFKFYINLNVDMTAWLDSEYSHGIISDDPAFIYFDINITRQLEQNIVQDIVTMGNKFTVSLHGAWKQHVNL